VGAIKAGKVNLDALTKSTGATSDKILKAGRDTADFGEHWQKFKNRALIQLEPVAKRVFNALGDGMKILNKDVVPAVKTFIGQMRSGEGAGGKLADILGKTRDVLSAVFGFLRDNKETVGTFVGVLLAAAAAAKVLSIVTGILNAVLLANPVVLIVVALAALAAGLVYAWKHSETFRTIVTGAFDAVKTAVVFVWDWIKKNWPLLLGILTGPIGLAVVLIGKNWDKIKAGAGAVKDWIVDKFDAVVGFFRNLPGRVTSAVSGLFDGIKSAFRNAVNFVIDGWNGLSFSLPGVSVMGKQVFDGVTISTPNIPRLAQGGIVQAQPGGILANIGEGRYDEAVVPLNGQQYLIDRTGVTPLPQAAPLPSAGAADMPDLGEGEALGWGGTLHVHVEIDGREVGEAVLDNFDDRAARR
jgi:phage-related protein